MAQETGGSSQRNFAFINALPVTESEREHSRLVVRSHSAQYGQRQRQKNWEELSKKTSGTVPSTVALPSKSTKHSKHRSRLSRVTSSSDMPSIEAGNIAIPGELVRYNDDIFNIIGEELDENSGRSSSGQDEDFHGSQQNSLVSARATTHRDAFGLRRSRNELAGAVDGRVSYFGAALVDPFSTLHRTPLPQAFLSDSISYLLSELIPALAPHEDVNPQKPITHKMFDLFKEDMALFYASLFGALCHRQMRELNNGNTIVRYQKRNTYFARYCKFEAVRLLRRALKSGDYWQSDTALFIVMNLGCHEWEETGIRVENKTFFRQPLSSLQSLDVYGSLSQDLVHLEALFRFIESRNGIETVKLPGLAATVSYGDILMASRFSTKPLLPFIPVIDSAPCSLSEQLSFDIPDVLRDFGRYEAVGLTHEICEIFEAIKAYQDCIAQYAYGGDLLKARYIDQRNLIQHHVVSLSALEASMDKDNWQNIIYESCRLAVQIYSSVIVFPLPPGAPVLGNRVEELRQLLSAHYKDIPKRLTPVLELLTWATTIAGVTATNRPQFRGYFVDLLKDLSPLLAVSTFETLKSKCLRKVLWFDSACDTAGQALWDEI